MGNKKTWHGTAIGIPSGKWSSRGHPPARKIDGKPAGMLVFHQTRTETAPINWIFTFNIMPLI